MKATTLFEVVAVQIAVEKMVSGTTTKQPGKLLTAIVPVVAADESEAKARFLRDNGSKIPSDLLDSQEVEILCRPFDDGSGGCR